jgi:hypothetical protein
MNLQSLVVVVLVIIVGVVLFVNGRKWAVALARRQVENPASATPVSEDPESDN